MVRQLQNFDLMKFKLLKYVSSLIELRTCTMAISTNFNVISYFHNFYSGHFDNVNVHYFNHG